MSGLPEVLTAAEAARLLRISTWSLYARVRAGEVPALRLGRSLRFARSAIFRLLEGEGQAADASGRE